MILLMKCGIVTMKIKFSFYNNPYYPLIIDCRRPGGFSIAPYGIADPIWDMYNEDHNSKRLLPNED